MKTKKIIALFLSIFNVLTCFSVVYINNAKAYSNQTAITWEVGRYNASSGTKETGTANCYIRSTDYIDVSDSKTITINYQGNYQYNIHFYNSSKVFVSSSNGQTAYASTPASIKVKGAYATVSIYKNPITVAEGSNISISVDKKNKSLNDELVVNKFSMGAVGDTTGEIYTSTVWSHTDYIDMSGYDSFFI